MSSDSQLDKQKSNEPSRLGDLWEEYERVQNPVTKSVLRKIISNRLNSLEKSGQISS